MKKRMFIAGLCALAILLTGAAVSTIDKLMIESQTVDSVGGLVERYLQFREQWGPIVPPCVMYGDIAERMSIGDWSFLNKTWFFTFTGEVLYVPEESALAKELQLPARIQMREDLTTGEIYILSAPVTDGVAGTFSGLAAFKAPEFMEYEKDFPLESYAAGELAPRRVVWEATLRPGADLFNVRQTLLSAENAQTGLSAPQMMTMSAPAESADRPWLRMEGQNLVLYVPEGFTNNRMEIYSTDDLISNVWNIAVQNLLPVSTNPAVWSPALMELKRYFRPGIMDIDGDSDGINDDRERCVYKTNPASEDTDDDGLGDADEIQVYATDPIRNDTDGDTLSDGDEVAEGLNPLDGDMDNDGFIDPYDVVPFDVDYPVLGEGVFNLISSSSSGSSVTPSGFDPAGCQKLVLSWEDSFWYPSSYRGPELPPLEQIFYAGSAYTLYEDSSSLNWPWLWTVSWEPDLPNALSYGDLGSWAWWGGSYLEREIADELDLESVCVLDSYSSESYTNYLCAVFHSEYQNPSDPIWFFSTSGVMRAVSDGCIYAYEAGDSYLRTEFKFVFNQPVTNRVIKWFTCSFDYDENSYINYAVHQCEVNGTGSAEMTLESAADDNLHVQVPTVALNGDFDLDGDVDEQDVAQRASADAIAPLALSYDSMETEPGSGTAPIIALFDISDLMPDSTVTLKLTGVDSGERFRMWSTTNTTEALAIVPMVIGGGGSHDPIIDPPLLIDTVGGTEYQWPIGRKRSTYAPFPKMLYIECIACSATNDGQAAIELTYEFDNEEICSAVLPLEILKIEMITPAGDPINSPADSGDGQNEFTFSTANPGILMMNLKARVTPNGIANQIKDRIHFTVDGIGSSMMTWSPTNPAGKPTASGDDLLATVTFTGLPANNFDFGRKKAAVYYDTYKQDEESYEVFFNKTATNHPEGIVTDPNWFYYWQNGQVCGIDSNCRYDSTASFGYTLPGTDNLIRLGPDAPEINTGPEIYSSSSTNFGSVVVTGQGKGIKCIAETIQHEQHHLDIYNNFNLRIAAAHENSGSNNGDLDDDPDGDNLPNIEESSFDDINSDPNNPDTFNMGGGYSAYGDNEVRCRKIELNQTILIYSESDWANPGSQTKNKWGP